MSNYVKKTVCMALQFLHSPPILALTLHNSYKAILLQTKHTRNTLDKQGGIMSMGVALQILCIATYPSHIVAKLSYFNLSLTLI